MAYTDGAFKALQGAASGVKVVEATVPAGELLGPPSLTTKPGEAYFWSGLGPGGDIAAANIAKAGGGTTLEMIAADRGIFLPAWDDTIPASVKAWEDASKVFANGVSGEVRVVVGPNLNPNGVWNRIELPALKANPNITNIVGVDPATGTEKIIWSRP